MRSPLVFALSLSVLVACASGTPGPPPPGQAERQPDAGDTALAVAGTPFLWAVKIPVCVVSAVIAAPIAAAAQLSVDGQETQRTLGEGVKDNCGPPWVLQP
jgi:hypothetical protein